ncbi:hypothetical protein HU200_040393 [Digitaria exilis]|uniref:F-box protein AT5G49610-like beta-propeller domain-containing protein n=1 Tax=Digitaria exilis TaxID=1010633 RepID=A0A835EJY9_9POAL|nr:hypothetical protein HU200_040393 [Digitaria exilis]
MAETDRYHGGGHVSKAYAIYLNATEARWTHQTLVLQQRGHRREVGDVAREWVKQADYPGGLMEQHQETFGSESKQLVLVELVVEVHTDGLSVEEPGFQSTRISGLGILLRLGFATTLVRAAAVSRRWLRVASNLAYLRRFRARHGPPPLLGFYYHDYADGRPHFLPVSQAPELAGAIRLATSSVDAARFVIKDTRGSRLLVHGYEGHNYAVLDPLHPTRDAATLPHPEDLYFCAFLAGGGGGVVSVCVFFPLGRATVRVDSQHAMIDVPRTAAVVGVVHAPVQGKIYVMTNCGYILVLVLASMSLSVLRLPDKVNTTNFKLSCPEDVDSGFFLIHGEGCLISIWRHEEADGNDGTHNNWAQVCDTFCVQGAFERQEDVTVLGADDNLEYVLLGLNRSKRFMSVHLRSWTEKVYDETVKSITFSNVKPFMMVWPPVFPAAKEGNVLEE